MIRLETMKPYAEGWQPPTKDEIRNVLELIRERDQRKKALTGVEVCDLVGMVSAKGTGKGSRTFRRWISGESEIPFAAWAILCHRAGLGIIWDEGTIQPDQTESQPNQTPG